MKIRYRIIQRLKELGWNQLKLSQETGISQNTISAYLQGKKDIRQETLKEICKALDLFIVLIPNEDLI